MAENPLGLRLSSEEVGAILPDEMQARLAELKDQEPGIGAVALSGMPFASGVLLEALGVIEARRETGELDEAVEVSITPFGQEVIARL